MPPTPAQILEATGQALDLASNVAEFVTALPLWDPKRRAANLRRRASDKRIAAARAVTRGGRRRKLARAVAFEAEADRLDPAGAVCR